VFDYIPFPVVAVVRRMQRIINN